MKSTTEISKYTIVIVQVADKSEKVASGERFVFGNGWEYNGDIEK